MVNSSRLALIAFLALAAAPEVAYGQARRGGMVGGRMGGAGGGAFRGSPSFSAPMARPAVNPGNFGRPGNIGGGMNRPNFGGNINPAVRPNLGGNLNPGARPNLGGNLNPGIRPGVPGSVTRPVAGIGDRPPFGGIGTTRPGGIGVNRPGGGLVGQRPGLGVNRPQLGDNLGIINRPNTNIVNRPNTNIVNRPTNIVNRPTNISSNIVNNNVTNITNINRGGFGGGAYGRGGFRPGAGWARAGGWTGASPYASYHRGWVNGFWNGNYSSNWGWGSWNSWGGGGYGYRRGLRPGLGLTYWGVGSLLNSWGYSAYLNPYYASAMALAQQPAVIVQQPVVYDYSQPLDVTSPLPSQQLVDQAVATLETARAAFLAEDYPQALKLADQALRETPNDPALHEFRGISLFALGRYDEAAVPLYTVLSVGPGWDWTTLSGLYRSVAIYTAQLRALEAFVNANPKGAAARFVLAALYLTQGSTDSAAAMFKQVVALQPHDKLSAQLVDALTAQPPAELAQAQADAGRPADAAPVEGSPPLTPQDAPPPVSDAAQPADQPPSTGSPVPAKLVGSWTASPARGVTIKLTLDASQGFTWTLASAGQGGAGGGGREIKGKASFEDETLTLTPPDQPPMVGKVTWTDETHYQFKAVDGPPDDPGLNFTK